jgi:hypothetical protein
MPVWVGVFAYLSPMCTTYPSLHWDSWADFWWFAGRMYLPSLIALTFHLLWAVWASWQTTCSSWHRNSLLPTFFCFRYRIDIKESQYHRILMLFYLYSWYRSSWSSFAWWEAWSMVWSSWSSFFIDRHNVGHPLEQYTISFHYLTVSSYISITCISRLLSFISSFLKT